MGGTVAPVDRDDCRSRSPSLAIALPVMMIGVAAVGVIGRMAFGVTTRPCALVGIVVLTIVGTAMFMCLYFAMTSLVRSNSAAKGVSNGVGIALAMTSGVFFAPSILPDAVGDVAGYSPLEPLANGYQSLYVTDASGVAPRAPIDHERLVANSVSG